MKEKQLKKFQMSACKQINLEVKESAEPAVHDLAKQKVLSLSKEIVPASVNKSLNAFIELQNLLTMPICFHLCPVYYQRLYQKIVHEAFL